MEASWTTLTALLLLPLVGAFLVALLRGRGADVLATAVAGVLLVLGIGLIPAGVAGPTSFLFGSLPWIAKEALLFGFLLDPLSVLMLAVVVIVGFLVVLYSTDYVGPKNREHPVLNGKGRYFFWMLLFIGSMIGVALAPNFLQLFIFWELTTLCSWALISYYEDEESLRAGFKALLMTHIGGLFLMSGIVILFTQTHSFAFEALRQVEPSLRAVLLLLILVGAWSKAAQVPFYTWLPSAMTAPTPVSAYLHAAAMVKAGVYLAARVAWTVAPFGGWLPVVLVVMAFVTMFVAVALFFFQDDLKRLLALSTISHLAYILVGCGLGLFGSSIGLQGSLLHIAAHAAGKGLLFLTVGMVAYFSGTRYLSELSGAARRLPLAGMAFFVGAFTVTGVPPFAGFWSKFYLVSGAIQLGGWGILVGALMVVESLIAFGWFLWVGQKVFLGEPSPAVVAIGSRSVPMEIALLTLILLCLLAPFLAFPLAHLIWVM